MRVLWRTIVLLLLGAVVVFLQRALAEEQAKIAKPAPAFVLRDIEDREVKLSQFDGKAILISFWATWDEPCRKQIQQLIELQQHYGDNEIAVVGVSLDEKGPEPVKAFAKEHKLNHPILMANAKVIQDFGGLDAIPTTFLIDRNHNIIQKYTGLTQTNTLEAEVKAVLKR